MKHPRVLVALPLVVLQVDSAAQPSAALPSASDGLVQLIDAAGDGFGNELMAPAGIAIDAQGNTFVAGTESHNVLRIGADGSITLILDQSGDGYGNELLYPVDTVVDRAGNLYVSGRDSDNVFRVTPDGDISVVVDELGAGAGSRLGMPLGLALDADDNLYVAGSETDNVLLVTPDGRIREILDETGDGLHSLDQPARLCISDAGNVYVTGTLSNNVFRIARTGRIDQIVDSSGDGEHSFVQPFGIAVDRADNVYVSSNGSTGVADSHHVMRLAPDGTAHVVLDSDAAAGGAYWEPWEVAVDDSGNVYVGGLTSASPAGTLHAIAPDGTVTEVLEPTLALGVPVAIEPNGGQLSFACLNTHNAVQLTLD